MITSIRGTLKRVLDDEVRVEVGAIEYQALVPEIVRRAIQTRVGEEVTLHTLHYYEGNPAKGRMIPRLVAFLSDAEIEFFELFCTVDGIGVRTALRALARSVRDVADMIQRQDLDQVSTLPGISRSTAERVIAKLRKKVTKFALMVERAEDFAAAPAPPDEIQQAYDALLGVGHSDADARRKLDEALGTGEKFKTAQEILLAIYRKHPPSVAGGR